MNEPLFVMHDSYLTLSTAGEAEFVEKRSRFISFAAHVETEEEAKAFVSDIRKRYYDARHVCYAYALGADVWAEDFDPIARGWQLYEPMTTVNLEVLRESRFLDNCVVVA